ncbi:MAG: thioredoxin fold domain-containing protein [Francisellaceae bacterium]|nr:thioredoxin fold domain-containing protein [Francisellaceae bacterium]
MFNRMTLIIITMLILLTIVPYFITESNGNIVSGGVKIAEIGGYKPLKIKLILHEEEYVLFHYYSQGCLSCEKQHLVFSQLKSTGNFKYKIVGVGAGAYPDYKISSNVDGYDEKYWDAYNELAKTLSIMGTPTIFLVNSQGDVLNKHIGYITKEEFVNEFKVG